MTTDDDCGCGDRERRGRARNVVRSRHSRKRSTTTESVPTPPAPEQSEPAVFIPAPDVTAVEQAADFAWLDEPDGPDIAPEPSSPGIPHPQDGGYQHGSN